MCMASYGTFAFSFNFYHKFYNIESKPFNYFFNNDEMFLPKIVFTVIKMKMISVILLVKTGDD